MTLCSYTNRSPIHHPTPTTISLSTTRNKSNEKDAARVTALPVPLTVYLTSRLSTSVSLSHSHADSHRLINNTFLTLYTPRLTVRVPRLSRSLCHSLCPLCLCLSQSLSMCLCLSDSR